MPRQNRRRDAEPRHPVGGGSQRTDNWRGQDFTVRAIAGQSAAKSYRCPGCDQIVAAGSPHLVVWPADDLGADDRRHWHRVCWDARDRRAPNVQRSRNGPRY